MLSLSCDIVMRHFQWINSHWNTNEIRQPQRLAIVRCVVFFLFFSITMEKSTANDKIHKINCSIFSESKIRDFPFFHEIIAESNEFLTFHERIDSHFKWRCSRIYSNARAMVVFFSSLLILAGRYAEYN